MTMYTIAGKSVTEDEFRRAAKVCIGKPLDESVVNIVFHIFDADGECSYCWFSLFYKHVCWLYKHVCWSYKHVPLSHIPGDGKLSHREFLSVMKNWKIRGFKVRCVC